ncbi:Uncharacterised protein [Mycobacteroides abscessus subsp. abscessus]|nr:Uncharacterised protein [Mycobacteroides abscessus subsp. abscessus]
MKTTAPRAVTASFLPELSRRTANQVPTARAQSTARGSVTRPAMNQPSASSHWARHSANQTGRKRIITDRSPPGPTAVEAANPAPRRLLGPTYGDRRTGSRELSIEAKMIGRTSHSRKMKGPTIGITGVAREASSERARKAVPRSTEA